MEIKDYLQNEGKFLAKKFLLGLELNNIICQILGLRLGKNANRNAEGVVLKGCGYNVVAYCLERLLETIVENSDMEYIGDKGNVYRFHTI